MNFDSTTPLWQRIAVSVLIAIGGILLVRLGVLAWQSRKVGTPMSAEEMHLQLETAAYLERQMWEKHWRESGAPPPPGGFDKAWERATSNGQ